MTWQKLGNGEVTLLSTKNEFQKLTDSEKQLILGSDRSI